MTTLPESQLRDALAYMSALNIDRMPLADDPSWGDGLRLYLPNVIPLTPDFPGAAPVAWLVSNDLDGYDLTMSEPKS